jgi:hypothetical protein
MPAPRDLLIVALFVLALRLPFLNQAIQGDDVYYLAEAQHAQIEPLHPKHVQYAFIGRMVDMRGQPHPPLNAWYLALLIATLKDVSEIPFHAAYILFSLVAAFSALALARKFSPHPLTAVLLFMATPAFVINGNSLESDLPFVAFWLLAIALFVHAVDRRSSRLLFASSLAMGLAALAAYQAIFLVPILFLYGRKWRAAALATLTAPLVLGSWQLFERFTTGAFPATVVAGYMQSYALQALAQKLKSAIALTGHLGWIVFPALWPPPLIAIPAAIGAAFYDLNPLFWGSVAVGVGILIWCARNWRDFLAQWVLIFFAGALVVFFAGSARYLLPIALPIAILATRRVGLRWIKAYIVCELVLSLGLAIVNYQHWNGYRQFARSLAKDAETKRVWINGEWGLRYYLESEGGLPLLQGQTVHPGEIVVSSSLSYPIGVTTGGGVLAPLAERTIAPAIPLRLVALEGKSAYSTTMFGLRPFDISRGAIDQLRAEVVIDRKPVLSDLRMNAPEAEQQIVSGVYPLENGEWRWMGKTAVILLKPPPSPTLLLVHFFVPNEAKARQIRIEINAQVTATRNIAPGTFTVESLLIKPEGDTARITITVDKTFSSQSDRRELGVILTEVGFRAP